MSTTAVAAFHHPYKMRSMMTSLSFTGSRSGRTAVVTAYGDIDASNAWLLEETLRRSALDGATVIIFDLTRIGFVDLQGLRAVLRLSDQSNEPFVLVRSGTAVHRIHLAVVTALAGDDSDQPRSTHE